MMMSKFSTIATVSSGILENHNDKVILAHQQATSSRKTIRRLVESIRKRGLSVNKHPETDMGVDIPSSGGLLSPRRSSSSNEMRRGSVAKLVTSSSLPSPSMTAKIISFRRKRNGSLPEQYMREDDTACPLQLSDEDIPSNTDQQQSAAMKRNNQQNLSKIARARCASIIVTADQEVAFSWTDIASTVHKLKRIAHLEAGSYFFHFKNEACVAKSTIRLRIAIKNSSGEIIWQAAPNKIKIPSESAFTGNYSFQHAQPLYISCTMKGKIKKKAPFELNIYKRVDNTTSLWGQSPDDTVQAACNGDELEGLTCAPEQLQQQQRRRREGPQVILKVIDENPNTNSGENENSEVNLTADDNTSCSDEFYDVEENG